MRRERADGEVRLHSRVLSAAEASHVLAELASRVQLLDAALAGGRYRLVGQVPAEADIVSRGRALLASFPGEIVIAASAAVC